MDLKQVAVEFIEKDHARNTQTPKIRVIYFVTEQEISADYGSPCWRVENIIEFEAAEIERVIEYMRALEKSGRCSAATIFQDIIIARNTARGARVTIERCGDNSPMHDAAPVLAAMHAQWLLETAKA
jgi:beta-lactamase class A